MKHIFTLFTALILLTSCTTQVAISPDYWNQKSKVGIIVNVDAPEKYKAGSQGLLDMAVTSGGKYDEALKLVAEKFQPKEQLILNYKQILENKGKETVVIDYNVDEKTEKKFEGEKQKDKKYARYDFRSLKSKYNVDEILFVDFKYGFMISYYGMIETGKAGFATAYQQIINLNDNSIIHADNTTSQTIIKKWKDDNYAESLLRIEEAAKDVSVKGPAAIN